MQFIWLMHCKHIYLHHLYLYTCICNSYFYKTNWTKQHFTAKYLLNFSVDEPNRIKRPENKELKQKKTVSDECVITICQWSHWQQLHWFLISRISFGALTLFCCCIHCQCESFIHRSKQHNRGREKEKSSATQTLILQLCCANLINFCPLGEEKSNLHWPKSSLWSSKWSYR